MNNVFKLLFLVGFMLTMNACTKGGEVLYDDNDAEFGDIVQFTKNVLVMEFVSFDCNSCPNVAKLIEEASQNAYPDRIDLISVHGRLSEDDPMEFPNYRILQESFYGVDGYPASVIDQVEDIVYVGTFDVAANSFLQRINATSQVGIALSSTVLNDNTINLEIQVGNRGDAVTDYYLAVVVLENGIIYKQADKNSNGETIWIDNYEHNHVLREFLSENYFGDAIGSLDRNEVYSKTYNYTVPTAYKKENLSFAAYVLQRNWLSGRVSLNSRSVEAGKSIGFSGKVN